MGKFIGIGAGAGAVVKIDGQVEGLGGLVQVEEKRPKATPMEMKSSQTAASKQKPKQALREDR